jgi:hypothetical protein
MRACGGSMKFRAMTPKPYHAALNFAAFFLNLFRNRKFVNNTKVPNDQMARSPLVFYDLGE